MRIGSTIDSGKPVDQVVEQLARFASLGLALGASEQIFGYDALTLFAAVGTRAPGIDLATAVVPVYSRHPQVMAQQALTVQAATGNRLVLGIGLSHRIVVEGLWGLSYDRPVTYMAEYLAALLPMLRGEAVNVEGTLLKCVTAGPLEVAGAEPPPVVVAALGPKMLRLAGEVADGTVTWMCGVRTIAEHIAPTIAAAARAAGRPAPRVGVGVPVVVTSDVEATKQRIDETLALYPQLPSYAAMLEREGATKPSDVALVGTEETVAAGVAAFEAAGTTELVASVLGDGEERRRTFELLASLAG